MPVLANATKVYLGTSPVKKIYKGSTQVWGVQSFDPKSITGLCLWLDAAQIGLPDQATVNPWPDMSGGGYNAITTGPFYGPKLVHNQLNGLPVVRFTAASGHALRCYPTPLVGLTPAYSGFILARSLTNQPNRIIGGVYPNYRNYTFGWHGSFEDRFYFEGWVFDIPAPGTTLWRQYTATISPSTPKTAIYKDRVLKYETTTINYGPNGALALSGYSETDGAECTDCEIAEILFYDRGLTDVERQQVEAYLQTKWGL